MSRSLFPLIAALTFLATTAWAAAAQSNVDGACPPEEGVTVVVDFQDLGRDTMVRCGQGFIENGLDVLAEARVAYDPLPDDPNVICRLEALPGDRDCTDEALATQRWTYWTARPGGEWRQVDGGPLDRDPPEGTVDGWSWSSVADPEPPRSSAPEPGEDRPDPDPPLDDPSDPDATDGSDGSGGQTGADPVDPDDPDDADDADGTRATPGGTPTSGPTAGDSGGLNGSAAASSTTDAPGSDAIPGEAGPGEDRTDAPAVDAAGAGDGTPDAADAGAVDAATGIDDGSATSGTTIAIVVLSVAALVTATVLIRRERRRA